MDDHNSSQQPKPTPEPTEPVWTFRGYQLRPGEFTTAMVHLFRAEISRANVWRQRLDMTTNWAVVITGAAITLAFNPAGFHAVIILSTLLITIFLYIEARRYRYYELWSYRIRLMETDFFSSMLVPPFHPSPDWSESMAENLLHPQFPISMWEAFGRRLRRNYLWIFAILSIAWLAKIGLLPNTANSWAEFFQRASIGGLPGELVLVLGISYNLLFILIGVLTVSLHEATGEVLPRYGAAMPATTFHPEGQPARGARGAWYRLTRRRRQMMATIITDQAEAISEQILSEMRRGVTSLQGTGMYTHAQHNILMIALTITEVGHLKSIVAKIDQNAFVIVTPAQEILGRGFIPINEDD